MNFLFGFRGRFGRLEWWAAQLFVIVAYVGFFYFVLNTSVFVLSDLNTQLNDATIPRYTASTLALIVPFVAVMFWVAIVASIKRYHDRNKSGWWYLICIVPLIGPIWQLVELGFLAGTEGSNDYDVYEGGSKPLPYSPKPNRVTEPTPAPAVSVRRVDVATGRPTFGAKPGFGTRRA